MMAIVAFSSCKIYMFLLITVAVVEGAYRRCGQCKCQWRRIDRLSVTRKVFVTNCSAEAFEYVPYFHPRTAVLDLSDNRLDDIPDFILESGMQILIIRNNQFSAVPNFTDVPNKLEYLDVTGNDVKLSEAEDISLGLSNLTVFKVESSLLSNDSFSVLKALDTLQLTTVKLLPTNVLQGIAETLKTLILEAPDVPKTIFHPLIALKELKLALPNLDSLPNDLFSDSALEFTLETLSIEAPHLIIPDRQLLQHLDNLTSLTLHLENAESLPMDVFYKPVESEERGDTPDNVKNRTYLRRITIIGVRSLPLGILDWVSRLGYLKISQSEHLHKQLLQKVPYLSTLELPYNSINEVFPEFLSSQGHLKLLNMSFNELETLNKDQFQSLTHVETLDLSHNNLRIIQENTFENMFSSLKYLNLSHNHICGLPAEVFQGMTSLQELHLQFNCLDNLDPDLFSDLTSLTHLHLQVNNISDIPEGLFDNMRDLRILDLNNNRIVGLNKQTVEKLFELPLNHLDLSGNDIRTFEVFVLPESSSMEYFLLGDNPLMCDCGVVPLLSLSKASGVCALPEELKNFELNALSSELVCSEQSTHELPGTTEQSIRSSVESSILQSYTTSETMTNDDEYPSITKETHGIETSVQSQWYRSTQGEIDEDSVISGDDGGTTKSLQSATETDLFTDVGYDLVETNGVETSVENQWNRVTEGVINENSVISGDDGGTTKSLQSAKDTDLLTNVGYELDETNGIETSVQSQWYRTTKSVIDENSVISGDDGGTTKSLQSATETDLFTDVGYDLVETNGVETSVENQWNRVTEGVINENSVISGDDGGTTKSLQSAKSTDLFTNDSYDLIENEPTTSSVINENGKPNEEDSDKPHAESLKGNTSSYKEELPYRPNEPQTFPESGIVIEEDIVVVFPESVESEKAKKSKFPYWVLSIPAALLIFLLIICLSPRARGYLFNRSYIVNFF